MKSRIAYSNIEDTAQAKLLSQMLGEKSLYTRILYYGQVINNQDSKNANRIKVRIPILDEIYYTNNSKEEGDSKLPWCLPNSTRFIDTPEQNQIVVVQLFDPKVPHFGRLYFDSITDLSASDLFEKLSPDEKMLSGWLLADNTSGINNPKPKKTTEYEVQKNIKYNIGIRGKGKNKLQLGEKNIRLSQNHNLKSEESYLDLAVDGTLETADKLNLLSKKGTKEHYHPVFDTKAFEYFEKQNDFFNKIVNMLATQPAISPVGPCSGSPSVQDIIFGLKKLKADLKKLKQDGSSKKIQIN